MSLCDTATYGVSFSGGGGGAGMMLLVLYFRIIRDAFPAFPAALVCAAADLYGAARWEIAFALCIKYCPELRIAETDDPLVMAGPSGVVPQHFETVSIREIEYPREFSNRQVCFFLGFFTDAQAGKVARGPHR